MTFGSTAVCWFNAMITSSFSATNSCNCGLMWNESWLRQPPAVTPLRQNPWNIFIDHRFGRSLNVSSSFAVSVSRWMHSRFVNVSVSAKNDIQNSLASSWPSNRSRSCSEQRSHSGDVADHSPVKPVFKPNASDVIGSFNRTSCTESPIVFSTLSKEHNR